MVVMSSKDAAVWSEQIKNSYWVNRLNQGASISQLAAEVSADLSYDPSDYVDDSVWSGLEESEISYLKAGLSIVTRAVNDFHSEAGSLYQATVLDIRYTAMYLKNIILSKKLLASGAILAGGLAAQLTGNDIVGAIAEIYALYCISKLD